MQKAAEFISDLKQRGLIYDCTDEEKLQKNLAEGKRVYLGIDPTAPSLHLGNYLALSVLKRFLNNGYSIVVLIGGMTAAIGDPSFRTSERPVLTLEEIDRNISGIREEIARILPGALVINNYVEFYKDLSIPSFIQDMCRYVNVNNLLDKQFLKDRLSSGLTLSELVYPLFQAWDFYSLYVHKDVCVQIGGSDQWGNIISGIDLIRKKTSSENKAVAFTFPLLVDSEGRKFGKSEGNALFLNPKLTSPYRVYQYLVNLPDSEVPEYLRKLSFSLLKDIEELLVAHEENKSLFFAQKSLAKAICEDIYGKAVSEKIQNISEKLFREELDFDLSDYELMKYSVPTVEYRGEVTIADALKDLGFASSNSEARRIISSGGIYVFSKKINDLNLLLSPLDSQFNHFVIRKGKKSYGIVYLNV